MKRNTLLLALFVLVTIGTSCQKESPLWSDTIPEDAAEAEQQDSDYSNPQIEPRSAVDTTLHLMVETASQDASAGTYTVVFSKDYSGSITDLSAQQQLSFTNGAGRPQQISMSGLSFSEDTDTVEVVLDYGSADLTGLSLDATQAIIVEEIIVN